MTDERKNAKVEIATNEKAMWNLKLLFALQAALLLTLPLLIYADNAFGKPVGDVVGFLWYGLFLWIRTLKGKGISRNTFSMWMFAAAFFALFVSMFMWGFDIMEVKGLIKLKEFFNWIPAILLIIEVFGGGDNNQGPPKRKDKQEKLKLNWIPDLG